MAINDLTSAIIEKRETVQRLKAEIQQIEHARTSAAGNR